MSWKFRHCRALLLCLASSASVHAQSGGDLQARIVYAYQAEDMNQLLSVAQSLDIQVKAGDTDANHRYHLAHADYRLGLLTGERHARGAIRAFTGCIDQLKALLEQDADSVEALLLQSACYSNLARLQKLEAVLLRSRAADRLAAAYRLAPRNPRVVFIRACDLLAGAKPGSVEATRGLADLELAAQLFEHSSATREEVPGWGHAEAYLTLGRQLEARGDVLGARNWIERSLLASPDYKAAQRELANLLAH